jgi:hypothetical protein
MRPQQEVRSGELLPMQQGQFWSIRPDAAALSVRDAPISAKKDALLVAFCDAFQRVDKISP